MTLWHTDYWNPTEVRWATNNVPSQLLPIRQWLHGNSCTWAHDELVHIAGTIVIKIAQQFKQGAQ